MSFFLSNSETNTTRITMKSQFFASNSTQFTFITMINSFLFPFSIQKLTEITIIARKFFKTSFTRLAYILNQITKQTFHSCNFEAIQIMSFFKIFCFVIFFIIMTNSTWVKFQTLRTLFMAISKIMRTVKHFLSRNRLIRILLIFIGF